MNETFGGERDTDASYKRLLQAHGSRPLLPNHAELKLYLLATGPLINDVRASSAAPNASDMQINPKFDVP